MIDPLLLSCTGKDSGSDSESGGGRSSHSSSRSGSPASNQGPAPTPGRGSGSDSDNHTEATPARSNNEGYSPGSPVNGEVSEQGLFIKISANLN